MYTKFLRLHILTDWGSRGSHDLNFSNRPVRTRMPGGVAGAQLQAAPYADWVSGPIELFRQADHTTQERGASCGYSWSDLLSPLHSLMPPFPIVHFLLSLVESVHLGGGSTRSAAGHWANFFFQSRSLGLSLSREVDNSVRPHPTPVMHN
jgi:hypothetical protein